MKRSERRILKKLKDLIKRQFSTPSIPLRHSYGRDRCFYINSSLGLLKFRSRKSEEIDRYRNDILNRADRRNGSTLVDDYLRDLYCDAILRYHAEYSATLGMRFRFVF